MTHVMGYAEVLIKLFSSCIFQLLASGGVDSTVCALLLNQALPSSQIITVHIDNGEEMLVICLIIFGNGR